MPIFALPIAEIAQLVEHDLAKVGVASSSLVFRSSLSLTSVGLFSYISEGYACQTCLCRCSGITGKALCEGMLRYMGSSPKFQPSGRVREMQLLFPASCFFRVLIAAREMHLVFQAAVSQSIIKCRAFHGVSKSPEKSTAFCTLLIIRQLKNDLHFPQVNRYAAIIGHLQSPMVHLPHHLPVILRIWTLFF